MGLMPFEGILLRTVGRQFQIIQTPFIVILIIGQFLPPVFPFSRIQFDCQSKYNGFKTNQISREEINGKMLERTTANDLSEMETRSEPVSAHVRGGRQYNRGGTHFSHARCA